jgi:capsule polysaccharide modification protein KpsS
MTLGKAVYDLEDLTYQGRLDGFWTEAENPINQNVRSFINLLLTTNQGRGTLSQCCFDVPGRCKIQWPKPFQEDFFPVETDFE